MDRFCTICGFQPKTYAGLAKHTARCYSRHLAQQSLELSKNVYETLQSNETKVHVCAADGLSSTVIVYDHIKKDKNADLAIADGISDALDMCAKDDLIGRKGPLSTSTQTPNHVDTFSLDFAFSFAAWLQRIKCTLGDVDSLFADNILLLIAFIISYCLFADELNIQQSLLDRATVVLIIILVNKTQLLLILGDRSTPSTLLARFIPTTKIRNLLLKSQVYYYCIGKLLLQNAAKSGILLACADGRIRQCYPTIFNCFRWKHYNFNIHVSLATDTLHLLLKEQKAIIQQLVAVVSPLFISKAPFALHFIRAHALTHIIQDIRMYRALDDRTYSTRVTRPLPFCRLGWLIPGIQPHSTKLLLSEVAANIAISDFTYAAAVCISIQIHSSIKCWRSSSKRHNDPEHCNEEVSRTVTDGRVVAQLYLILIIIDYTRYDKDRKHMAYIRAFSEVLLFNNNRQIDNTTRMLTFKFYDLSMIIRSVHLVPRDLPDSITRTTMSYYVNNYINWDEYNRLYSPTFDIDLLRTL
ncbi:hypothetical protein HBI33_226610 [Parastagonospora nodorum]|nr:hypothetical protein HBI33_226610 [Parastagonospora nodorum]